MRIFAASYISKGMTEQITIQSDIACLPVVEERLFHVCHELHVGNYYSAVSVAAMQAVKNAVVHGNASDRSKKVEVTMGSCRGGLFVEVADEGNGFDYSCYGSMNDCHDGKGEGIFVMYQLSDRISFSHGGSRVRMEFDVMGIDPADALERIVVLRQHMAKVAA